MGKEMEKKKLRRRNRWIVDRRFQLRLTFFLVLLQVNVGIFFHALLTFRVQQIANEATSLKAFVGMDLWKAGLPALGVAALLTSIAVYVIGIRYSNQIVGPLPRIRRNLKQLGRGEKPTRLHLRRGDVLAELAASVNELADTLYPGPPRPASRPRPGAELGSTQEQEPNEVSVSS